MERVQDVEVQEREEAILEVEVTSEKATVTWHKVGFRFDNKNEMEWIRSTEYCMHLCYFFHSLLYSTCNLIPVENFCTIEKSSNSYVIRFTQIIYIVGSEFMLNNMLNNM